MKEDKSDREIQEALDKGLLQKAQNQDQKTYLSLYEKLERLPVTEYLPDSFADDIVSRVELKPRPSRDGGAWWLGGTILFMMLTGGIVMALTMSALLPDAGPLLVKYAPIVATASVLIFGVQWFDQRLIKT